ncbi:hypothetical protein IPL68_02400 [Candidatus Saccharibacteria bacterium]|nr:MAG: hypothetical protein IPL68_02400 [Candidatus Saccharibacteria bacterium]
MDTQTTPSTSPEAAVTATPPATGSVMDVMPPSGPAAQAPVVAAPATTDSGAEAPVAQAPTAVDVPVDQAHAASAATDTPKESSVPKPRSSSPTEAKISPNCPRRCCCGGRHYIHRAFCAHILYLQ